MKIFNILGTDGRLLFATRIVRLFAYGFLSVIFVIYLSTIGLSNIQISWLLTLTLIGDAAVSLWISVVADRIGRKKMLILGATLMIFAGIIFSFTNYLPLLIFAAVIGVISPSGNEVGPFLSIEQSSLSHIIPGEERTRIFAWYNLTGAFATALGALSVGIFYKVLFPFGQNPEHTYRILIFTYAIFGSILIILFQRLSAKIEVIKNDTKTPTLNNFLGLNKSLGKIMKLSSLFALDAFGGGFVLQSVVAYWFYLKFGLEIHILGGIFLCVNILAGASALVAARLAKRFGLINTMVFTHIPSNFLLILVPLMPNLPLAVAVYFLRSSISQMDVPTRQSYTMAVVNPDERSAAAGVTNIARTLGASISPIIIGIFLTTTKLLGLIFVLAGGIKIVYDLILYYNFRHIKPNEEAKS